MKMVCHNCGNETQIPERVGFRQTCQSCDAWLHSCVHCRFWSGSNCTEPAADKFSDPDAQNYCDWYKERAQDAPRHGSGRAGDLAQEGKGRNEAEELWKKLTKK